ncbi:hypothetical protein ACIRBX_17745 [Kitasatospora sp. NPDC096147]|uniref:WXG100-like domain-containing protein n=1 Tax=Kitasatospora sp. NPDC096147 TaxID=3364093 RepID=UPI0037FF0E1D
MAIEPPGELAWVMDVLGFRWPAVDEDRVREFAERVRRFAADVDGTHQAATATVRQMAEHYEADSYRVLAGRWDAMSAEHLDGLVEVCGVVALAIDLAADAVVAAKLAVIAELTIAAAEFAAATAATAATFGAAAAAEAALVAATRQVVDGILRELAERIAAELASRAFEPLERVVEGLLAGLALPGPRATPDPGVITAAPAAEGRTSSGCGDFRIAPGELLLHADLLHRHAEQVAFLAREFTTAVEGVSFE